MDAPSSCNKREPPKHALPRLVRLELLVERPFQPHAAPPTSPGTNSGSSGGAWRTLRGHVRRWERYENFGHDTDKPLFDVDLLLSYMVALKRSWSCCAAGVHVHGQVCSLWFSLCTS